MIILGIDPGTISMGYGVVQVDGDRVCLIACGAVKCLAKLPLAGRLLRLHTELDKLVIRYTPSEVAIEEPFVAENPRSAMAVGRAQAVAMLAAAQHGLPVFTYTPTQVKQAVTSYGGSSKEQVQEMVRLTFSLSEAPHPNDASDALAIALCHQRQTYLNRLVEAGPERQP